MIIVSTGGIRWILWFSVCYTAAATHREIFGVNTLRGKLHHLGSPNWQDIFIGGVSFSGKEKQNGRRGHFFENSLSTFFYWLFLIGRRLNVFIGDMCNRYICPLQPCRHLTLKLLIQGHPRSAKVTHIVDKVVISPLLLVLEVCNVKPTYRKSCAANLLMWSDLTLDPSFKVK